MSTPRSKSRSRIDALRMILAAVIGAAVTAFALLNLNDVSVHWIFTTRRTPLIVVIIVPFALGVVADRALVLRARRKRRSSEATSDTLGEGRKPPELD